VSRKAWLLILVACAAPAGQDGPQVGVACSDGDPAVQRHGARCLCCHADDFSVAGSVAGTSVARVVVTDANGDQRSMAPNLFGNFFGHFPLTPPFRAIAYGPDGRSVAMNAPAPHADCNACHAPAGPAAPIYGP